MNNLHSNIYIRVAPQQNLLLNFCQEKKVKFFLDYDYNINNFCRLKNAIDQGVSDVYIMEDLCYHLPRVKELCDKNNVKIRCILNLIPSFTLGREEDPTSTFYVPENLDVLKTFYNVFEFELFDS